MQTKLFRIFGGPKYGFSVLTVNWVPLDLNALASFGERVHFPNLLHTSCKMKVYSKLKERGRFVYLQAGFIKSL
jgi:hypothetical protein